MAAQNKSLSHQKSLKNHDDLLQRELKYLTTCVKLWMATIVLLYYFAQLWFVPYESNYRYCI